MVAELWLCAEAYREQNPGFMVTAFVSLYIALQSFAIPGTIILSILSGALYPLAQAQALVALCATIGSSTCYLLSFMFGRVIIKRKFPEAMASFKHKIDRNRDHLMFFMIFLRLTPLVPNAFVNMASSMVGIPFNIFFMGTMLGLLPANFIHAQTGRSLRNVTVQPEARWGQMAVLFGLQFVALLPVLIKKKLGKVIDVEEEEGGIAQGEDKKDA
ncbi:snare associated Golgi protein-domain-containing protein [Tribonema minus]|uniref:Snare associated Golgi protein-domain-containing protein n=1 Tax=Tribonema minus TaxID=303371 RepID=A0A835ZKY2_9STRA|nr:snare associated Golgi protein-domain-containing protein [Tribonema minus]